MTKLATSASKIDRAAYILKAVAHPLRIKTIEILDRKEEVGVNELALLLDAEQSLVSHHLSKMYDKGILSARREGKNIYYSLTDKTITGIISCINSCKKI